MKSRYSSKTVVFLILRQNINGKEHILLQRRINVEYMNNMYDLGCSGHLEQGESISMAVVREAKEELGIAIKEEDVELLTMVHPYDEGYFRFFFTTDKYEGIPKIMEKNKCDDLDWFPIDNLPDNTIEGIKNVLINLQLNINYDDGSFTRQKAIKMKNN